MGAHNLAEFFDRLAALISRNQPLLDWLDNQIPSNGPARLEAQLGKLTDALNHTSASAAWKKVKPVREDMVERSKKARRSGSHDLPFIHVDQLLRDLHKIENEFPALEHEFTTLLKDQLSALSDSYNGFLSENSPGAFFAFLRHASECHRSLSSTRDQALLASAMIGVPKKDAEGILSVGVKDVRTAEDVAQIVELFERIYTTLAPLLDVDLEEDPLVIAYIEVGSIWTWLKGRSDLIKLLSDCVRSFFGYVHRNYTVQGRVMQIPEKAAAAQQVAALKSGLEEAGIDTSGMEDALETTGALLAEELLALLRKGNGFAVGDDSLSFEENALLKKGQQPNLIEAPKDEEGPNEEGEPD